MKIELAFRELELLLNHEQQLRLSRIEVNDYGSDKIRNRITELRTFIDSQVAPEIISGTGLTQSDIDKRNPLASSTGKSEELPF